MLKNIKKTLGLFCLIIFAGIILTSCELPAPTPGTGTPSTGGITEKALNDLPFEDLTVEYDGEPHSIIIDNIYAKEGVIITYINNGQVDPGTYKISAMIKYKSIIVNRTATLTIEKKSSTM